MRCSRRLEMGKFMAIATLRLLSRVDSKGRDYPIWD